MSSMSAVVFLAALAVFGGAFVGLFNPRRSILCALAGILLALGAVPSVMHAWGEDRSIPFTIGYLAIGLMGLVATIRQFRQKARKAE